MVGMEHQVQTSDVFELVAVVHTWDRMLHCKFTTFSTGLKRPKNSKDKPGLRRMVSVVGLKQEAGYIARTENLTRKAQRTKTTFSLLLVSRERGN